MSWISPRAHALVDAARPAMSLDQDRAARMRARMLAATGATAATAVVASVVATKASAPAASASAASAAPVASVSAGMGIGAKLALVVLGAAAVAAGTHAIDRMMMSPAEVAPAKTMVIERAAPAAAPHVVMVPAILPVPVRVTTPAAPARSRALVSNAPPPAPRVVSADEHALLDETPPAIDQGADALARELAFVRNAQAALRAGDGAAALVALDAHDRDFPAGQLAEEAGVLRVEALCAVGRAIDASDARAEFLARFPRSAQTARARRACGGGGGP
jgi:hypothetical protein